MIIKMDDSKKMMNFNFDYFQIFTVELGKIGKEGELEFVKSSQVAVNGKHDFS